MVTRVLDTNGAVVHDCRRDVCSVSWDGYALTDQTVDVAGVATKVLRGQLLPGAAPPDPALWDVVGNTATRKGG